MPAKPIPIWKLCAGGFLHFSVPAYLIGVLANWLIGRPPASGVGAVLSQAIQFTPLFIAGYVGLAVIATGAAYGLERRRPPPIPLSDGPTLSAIRSAQLLGATTDRHRGVFGAQADALLSSLGSAVWDHDDPNQQALIRDLAQVTDSAAQALALAAADRRPALAALATDSIARIAAAHDDLLLAKARGAEQEAQVIARYVELRYGSADFASEGD